MGKSIWEHQLTKEIAELEKGSTDALALTLFLTVYDLTEDFPSAINHGIIHYQKAYKIVNIIIQHNQHFNFDRIKCRKILRHCFNQLLRGDKVKTDFLVNHI